ncbi:MAG: MFS transporter [Dehalococcoidia bacterium]|nr:MFS transporter [Dehalococcoidia bacterium]
MADATPLAAAVTEQPRRKTFYGWWIVGAGAGIQLLQSALLGQAYGSYVVLLREEFGWSKTALAAASSLREMETGITGPFQGWLLDRLGPRVVARAGVLLFALGLMLFSQVQSLLTFYLTFVVMALGMSLMGYLTITFAVVQWFERKRATAISLSSAGFAIGGMVIPGVVFLLESFGWRWTAFASGVAVLVIGLPLTQVLRHRPSDYGLLPDGDPPAPRGAGVTRQGLGGANAGTRDHTLAEAMRTRAFWFIAMGHGSALFVVSAMNVHLVSHLKESLDYSLGEASTIVFLMTLLFLTGTVSGGLLGDRVNKRLLVVACMGMHAAGLVLLSHATGLAMVIAFALLHGLAWGWRGPQMAAIRADYFGPSSFGKILGVSNIVIIVGTISGPIIAGQVYDQTGNYRIGFDILAAIAALGSIFFILARRPARPAANAPQVIPAGG